MHWLYTPTLRGGALASGRELDSRLDTWSLNSIAAIGDSMYELPGVHLLVFRSKFVDQFALAEESFLALVYSLHLMTQTLTKARWANYETQA